MSYQPRKESSEIPFFIPTIDFNLALWMAYQNCVNAPIFGRFQDSFASCVRILCSMIDQEGKGQNEDYADEQYRKETDGGDPMQYFRAAGRLMHRKGFFNVPTKNLGHL